MYTREISLSLPLSFDHLLCQRQPEEKVIEIDSVEWKNRDILSHVGSMIATAENMNGHSGTRRRAERTDVTVIPSWRNR